MKVGTKIDLATNDLTKHFGVAGRGMVTAVRLTDPVNHTGLVIVKTAQNNFLHITNAKGIK